MNSSAVQQEAVQHHNVTEHYTQMLLLSSGRSRRWPKESIACPPNRQLRSAANWLSSFRSHKPNLNTIFSPRMLWNRIRLIGFRRLLSKIRTVFELDGSRDDSSPAYHSAGTIVLNQSDLLIVVWDGERKNQRGGTEETYDDAIKRGVPVIWIDGHAPHHWRIVTQPIRKLEEINRDSVRP